MLWLAVGLGGALGSIARHGANVAWARWLGQPTLYATAFVNISGSLIIGLLAGLAAVGTLRLSEPARMFVFVGVLGGFTTFSSFGLDTLTLVRSGATGVALANVATQVVIGVGSVFFGYWVGKSL
jgi:fluoride exporter